MPQPESIQENKTQKFLLNLEIKKKSLCPDQKPKLNSYKQDETIFSICWLGLSCRSQLKLKRKPREISIPYEKV